MKSKALATYYGRQRGHCHLYAGNQAFVEMLYEDYLEDPASVSSAWREYFDQLKDLAVKTEPASAIKQAGVVKLVIAYRELGHLYAQLDPLGSPAYAADDLDPAHYGLTKADMNTPFHCDLFGEGDLEMPLVHIIALLQRSYCYTVGAEYMYISDAGEKRWIQQRLERRASADEFSAAQRRQFLQQLVAAEGLERYLHRLYPGQKRFSLEGGESLMPLLHALIRRARNQGLEEVVMGMAHRGRLNVLTNLLGKPPQVLCREFEDRSEDSRRAPGDAKYHQGFAATLQTPAGPLQVTLAFNPSHLESVNPVVQGMVRARQAHRNDEQHGQVLPLLIHGDAAFSGQGVVMETLTMSQTRGFSTGGTVHVVINNQVGFTTSNTRDARSSRYCTGVARMIEAPVFHVNGDDPEAVVFVAHLALDYRQTFNKDVVIDLVCYRRHGHNEADEPAVTQPKMYRAIRCRHSVAALYHQHLVEAGVASANLLDNLHARYLKRLEAGEPVSTAQPTTGYKTGPLDWQTCRKRAWQITADTHVLIEIVQRVSGQLTVFPDGFELHPRVQRIIERRKKMAREETPIDWGFAEMLAYGCLVTEGHTVRLSGQDSGRGTFFHRHAVLHCQNQSHSYRPLQQNGAEQGVFQVVDSLLSEEAVLGFEYGYAVAAPEALIVWEAQFGDFANSAQVVIDQFISAGEAKWGRPCGLVMLLPHGYEGQGPEHSSARPERFLQLCAEENIQVAVPTTPAQMFHLLRRQALRPHRKPLVVMTPKSLLRNPSSTSSLEELTNGRFEEVLGDDEAHPEQVKRIVICTGKLYFELLQQRQARALGEIAIIRIEQLYPFPQEALSDQLKKYLKAEEIVWCQEEPQNQGAWTFMYPRLSQLAAEHQLILYTGRPARAATAEGSLSCHLAAQDAVISAALCLKRVEESRVTDLKAVS